MNDLYFELVCPIVFPPYRHLPFSTTYFLAERARLRSVTVNNFGYSTPGKATIGVRDLVLFELQSLNQHYSM